jgi:cbb3-type cytochrome oxidase subunit 3
MYKDLLAHTPLLALPLFAMFVFLAVFVAVVVRAFARRDKYADAARLPFEDDHE